MSIWCLQHIVAVAYVSLKPEENFSGGESHGQTPDQATTLQLEMLKDTWRQLL